MSTGAAGTPDAAPGVATGTPAAVSAALLFSRALQGHRCSVVGVGEDPQDLPVRTWTADADATDTAMLGHCRGPTIDIGCGPGRLSARLVELGHVVLGVDVVHEAVRQARERGVSALVRDVFERLPGEGRWRSALLADGNVGIGGDPAALLSRVRELICPGGRVVVELSRPGTGLRSARVALHCDGARSAPFSWSFVGVEAIHQVARAAGLVATQTHVHSGRWFSVLEEEP